MAGGNTLSFLNNNDGRDQFCCGLLVAVNDTVSCADNRSSFALGSARLMYGFAALENATLTSDVNDPSSTTGGTSTASVATAFSTGSTSTGSTDGSCQDGDSGLSTTIGVGVGVPLGVIALLAVAWGFWERRRRVRAQKATEAAVAGGDPQNHQQASRSYYEKWQVPNGGGGGGHLQAQQPGQQTGTQVAELHSQSRPAEMTET